MPGANAGSYIEPADIHVKLTHGAQEKCTPAIVSYCTPHQPHVNPPPAQSHRRIGRFSTNKFFVAKRARVTIALGKPGHLHDLVDTQYPVTQHCTRRNRHNNTLT